MAPSQWLYFPPPFLPYHHLCRPHHLAMHPDSHMQENNPLGPRASRCRGCLDSPTSRRRLAAQKQQRVTIPGPGRAGPRLHPRPVFLLPCHEPHGRKDHGCSPSARLRPKSNSHPDCVPSPLCVEMHLHWALFQGRETGREEETSPVRSSGERGRQAPALQGPSTGSQSRGPLGSLHPRTGDSALTTSPTSG